MSESAIEAKLLRFDLLKSGLDPNVVDLLAPPPTAVLNQSKSGGKPGQDEPFVFKLFDPIISED